MDSLRAQDARGNSGVDRGVASADHDGSRANVVPSLSLVGGDEADRVDHSRQILAGNAELLRRAQTDAEKNGVELALQLIERDVRADFDAGADVNAQRARSIRSRARLSPGVNLYSATP